MLSILIVDDHEIFRDGLSLVLRQLDDDLEVVAASTARKAIQLVNAGTYADVILVDFNLPDGDGLTLMKEIKAVQPATPVILLSGHETSRLASQSLAAGASGFIPKSLPTAAMLAAVRLVLEGEIYVPVDLYRSGTAPSTSTLVEGRLMTLDPRVLDHNPSPVLIFARDDVSFPLLYANAATALHLGIGWAVIGQTHMKDCFIDDEVFAELTTHADTKHEFPDVRMVGVDHEARWFSVSTSPVEINHRQCLVLFLKDVTALKSRQQELARLAVTDTLTNVLNRRGFFESAERELQRARRFNHPFCVAVMDLDHFKHVNDTDGHEAGDTVLKSFARFCEGQLRDQDLLGRLGGEEFMILLVHVDLATGERIANRLREGWKKTAATLSGAARESTVSIGLVGDLPGEPTLDALLRQADTLLYAAKAGGRDRVVVAS